jgi:capsular polysaccharide biosynthesis protein
LPDNYHTLSSNSSDIEKIIIYSAETIIFPNSESIETNLPKSLSIQTKISPESFIAILPLGRVWADRFNSAVFTKNNLLVKDISTGSPELVVSSNNLCQSEFIDGTVAFLSTRWGYNTYYHWMLDIVSRFDLLARSGININDIDRFVFNRTDGNYRQECLHALGIPNEKMIESQSIPHIQAKKIIVPSLPTLVDGGFRTHTWICQFLKNLFLPRKLTINANSQAYPEKIYISRSQTQYRQVINESEVIDVLSKLGFYVVCLESLSVQEQALYLYHANVVISAHGAGLTNLVFCQVGTKVIEIFAPEYVTACYKEISHICHLSYYYLFGDRFVESKDQFVKPKIHDSLRRNILINVAKLKKILKLVGIS